MSADRFGKNKKKKSAKVAVAVSCLLGIFCICAGLLTFFYMGSFDTPDAKADNSQQVFDVQPLKTVAQTDEMRGLWIASVINIDYPSATGLDEASLKKELDDIVENACSIGINSIFFQVRPASDALYKSDIFPQSKYVSGTQGEPVGEFDSLKYLIDEAKKRNIDVHAWVNPYRVTMYEEDVGLLSDSNPAKIHPEYTIKYADGKTYYDPGNPEVRKLVVSGIRELVENYPELSGVHFDDYFYPYPVADAEFDDSLSFEKYSNGLELSDWRRNNVNMLVKDAYEQVKSVNPECKFGVSVFGIWANSSSDTYVKGSNTNGLEAYNSLYCDALSWAKGGYVDYLIPQNYWSFGNVSAPFDEVARWWNANLDGTGVDLYIGHAAYKAGDYNKGEIARQVDFSRTLANYKGSVFYGYSAIKNNDNGVCDDINKVFEQGAVVSNSEQRFDEIHINFPENNSYVNSKNTYILGYCDPTLPLYLDGEAVSKTLDGYFCVYLDLEKGENSFVFSQGDSEKVFTVNYATVNKSGGTTSSYKTMEKFEILNPTPLKETWLAKGASLKVSCAAASNSIVTATVGGITVTLSPTINPPDNAEYMYEVYSGSITPSDFAKDDEIVSLGTLVFDAVRGEERATLTCSLISQKGDEAYSYAEVKEDYTHTKVGTSSSFYDDFLPSSKGMRDYVVDTNNGYSKLKFGGYISTDELAITYGKPLLLNTILTTAVEVVCTDNTNNKNNTTDIRFGVTENIPVDVDFRGEGGKMRIIIYNTDTSIIPQFEVPANPLIKSIEGKKGTRENMLMYYVEFKDNENFYGFNIVYENGCMIVKLNNPQKLKEGDKPLEGKKIVVDAGHGGADIGAPGPGKIPEAQLNQSIATEIVKKLEDLGAEVVQSRPGDETVDLYKRMDILNAECPDMALSIHHNSIASSANAQKTRGFLALYSNNSGVSLSKTISEVVCRQLNREQKATSYQQLAVARNHRFPSTLLEMCFISNVEEYQWSISEGNYERSAQAVVDGILEYYKRQEKYLEY